jgi:hypothetical protein
MTLTDDAHELATNIRDRARNAFLAARAQIARSDEMRERNEQLKERVATRTSEREPRR